MKRFIAVVPATLVLFGCAAQPTTWMKPGLTQEEFAKDRYSCMQQSQQRVSVAFANQYGGSASNHEITNANLFNACMNAQGYTLQKQASVDQAKAALDVEVYAEHVRVHGLTRANRRVADDRRQCGYEQYKYYPNLRIVRYVIYRVDCGLDGSCI